MLEFFFKKNVPRNFVEKTLEQMVSFVRFYI